MLLFLRLYPCWPAAATKSESREKHPTSLRLSTALSKATCREGEDGEKHVGWGELREKEEYRNIVIPKRINVTSREL